MIFTRPFFIYIIPLALALSAGIQIFNLVKKRKLIEKILATGHKSKLNLSDMRAEIIKEILISLALTSFLIAAAGPASESDFSSLTKTGIDLVFLCDVSRSMDASSPIKKIESAKRIMTGVIERRDDDRIALVLFSGSATVVSPLTFDHRSIKASIHRLSTGVTTSTGTSFISAFSALPRIVEKETSRSTAVLLLSDGEDFGGDMSDELAYLQERNIPVLTVGIGDKSGDPVPEVNYKGEVEGYIMLSPYDTAKTYLEEENLTMISERTNGVYIGAENPTKVVNEISAFLETLQKGSITQEQEVLYVYHYEIPLAAGAFLIALSITVEKKRRSSKWSF
ncbi:VWA domain-containing protein [candidate division WOR-3 bacterium]|nr:VWA domain-containing protein [candidate division WOR-3 bacterium]